MKSSAPKHLENLYNVLGSLSFEISHWFNHGKFSIYDVIEYILTITGKAELKITSFTISEEAISRFIYFERSGMISGGRFIIDISSSKSKFNALSYLAKTFDVRLNDNHTKIILIRNENYNIVISTSANLNQNRRHENGFVSTDLNTYLLFEEFYDQLFNQSRIIK